MAIRDSVRRVLRLSGESDNSSQADNSLTSTASSSKTSISSKSSGLRPTRSWTWGSNNKAKEMATKERKARSKPAKRYTHPSEKPLTEQNLRHQEMLSQFTWTFGASRPDQVESDSFVGISPCCTRAPSLADYDPSGDSDGFSSSQDSQLT
ncbi:hypothetical protein EDB81DRAFT_170582 [Dactylonectria macrodidyma]|uniref:Uncharacterized protein n=1 Tax=Dactylonectria macrodidyma TaxID=307937 RepID=A0A9P9FPT4_9HYPO|nr:hypothetical protein EDB81DRAFT_170582 [Dactylonectria macrodidyma]